MFGTNCKGVLRSEYPQVCEAAYEDIAKVQFCKYSFVQIQLIVLTCYKG